MPQTPTAPPPWTTLVLGGARSGKSDMAERLALEAGRAVYLATAETLDDEMRERVARHRLRRGGVGWTTHEEPIEIVDALRRLSAPDRPILVDCLTIWLSNLIGAGRSPEAETGRLIAAIIDRRGPLIFVSNEVGQGVVPATAIGRIFRDEAGRLNQAVAAAADRVFYVVAGLAMTLKEPSAR